MKPFKEKIRELIKKDTNLNTKKLAESLGVSQPLVSQWRTGLKKPSVKNMQKLADIFQIDVSYLMDDRIEILQISNKATTNVGVLEMVAGFGTEGVLDVNFKIDYELCLPKEFLGKIPAKHARIIRCLGDSMEPEFQNGDYLLVEMLDGRYFIKREGIYLVRVGEIVYIKRVLFLPNGDAKLISINPSYGIIQPIKDLGYEYEILGAVYGKISVKLGSGFQFDNQGIK